MESENKIRRAYLAGPIEYANNFGRVWREEYSQLFKEFLNIECIIPEHEEKHIIETPEILLDLKKNNPREYINRMRQLQDLDLQFVEDVDIVVVHWNGERMSGTIGEAQHARLMGVPIYLVTKIPFVEIPGWFAACFDYENIFDSISCLMMQLADQQFNEE